MRCQYHTEFIGASEEQDVPQASPAPSYNSSPINK